MVQAIYKLSEEYTTYSWEKDRFTGKSSWVPLKTFGIYVDGGREFRFVNGQWDEFQRALTASLVTQNDYELIEHPLYVATPIQIEKRTTKTLYPEQEEARAAILENDGTRRTNCTHLAIPTGGGKTLTALLSAQEIGRRIAVIVLAGYKDKWLGDIQENLAIEPKEIAEVKSGTLLERTTHWPAQAHKNPLPKAFVFTLDTLTRWFDKYEESRENPALDAYGCLPHELCEHLDIGTVIFDESHQHLHAIFRVMTYLHVPKVISLSATMVSGDDRVRRIQNAIFPRSIRFEKIKMKRYIRATACMYNIMNFSGAKIRTSEFGRTSYSQVAYEKSLMNNKRLLRQYLDMILALIDEAYLRDKLPEDRLVIFVGLTKMARQLAFEIKQRFRELDTRVYLQGSPLKDMLEPDIRVTTIGSGGTAHDVPNLRVTILTNAIDSIQSNYQVFGRLRELKDRDTRFYYFCCSSIPKHVEYHKNKVHILSDRTTEQTIKLMGTLHP